MIKNKDTFIDLVLFDKDLSIIVGDGAKMMAKGHGIITAELFNGRNWIQRKILNVPWVPNLCEEGLISLGVLTEQRRFRVELRNKELKVYDESKVILTGTRGSNHLYSLKIRIKTEKVYVAVESLQLWHERLAHISEDN